MLTRLHALSSLLIALVLGPLALSPSMPSSAAFDLVIRGGRVMDGTGNPWVYADVGVRDGRIAAVGDLRDAVADRVIDATGLVVAPGFIDLHSHADDGARASGGLRDDDPQRRAAPNLVMQGITTVVVNQDGRSPWPIREQRTLIESLGIGPNAILLVGHGTVRREAMGPEFRRPATAEEVATMQALVRQGLDEGAWGLSAGLEYTPGRWSTTDEVVAVAQEIVPYGGVYIAHQRSEGADPMWYWPTQDSLGTPTLIDGVLETIEVGERTGATVVASHLKAKGAHYWGTSQAVIQLIEAARARGVSVWGDQYPYTTSGTDGNTVLLPRWPFAADRWPTTRSNRNPFNYTAALENLLQDPEMAARIERDVRHEIRRRGGPQQLLVLEHPEDAYVGQTLGALAMAQERSPVEMAFQLQRDGDPHRLGGGRLRGFSMSEVDVDAYAAQPWMATVTDGGIALLNDRPVHPRFYGAFPRKLRRYAMERGALSVDDAVRSATSLPAHILGLRDRGQVREGFAADLVVMDLETLRDRATPFEPHQYPDGIVHVLINGELAVEDGAPTFALLGQVLTPPSPSAAPQPQDD
ncbi:MAG: D-aminoacylase [Bacteroidota bacterium]